MSSIKEALESYKVEYFDYSGNYLTRPNSQKNSLTDVLKYTGLLLKIQDEQGNNGYANYHALPSFGDLSASDFLQGLKSQNFTQQHKLIFSYLLQDLQNRVTKVDSLSGAFLIENHKLITDPITCGTPELEKIFNEKFKFLKIKMGHHLQNETEWILKHKQLFKKHNIKLRLDFNETFGFEEFQNWIMNHNSIKDDLIDYFEDPTPYNAQFWKSWENQGLRLARDVQGEMSLEETEGVKIFVLKPARLNIIEWLKKLPHASRYEFVVTHYMDTALGQSTALSAALKLKFFVKERLLCCGLLPYFEAPLKEVFKNPTITSGPHLMPKEDLGYGWTRELQNVEWKAI